MNICERIKEAAIQSGMWQADFIDTKDLSFYPEIREICKENACFGGLLFGKAEIKNASTAGNTLAVHCCF